MEKTKGKLLIVDDNSMNIELLEATLESLEYEIISYSDPVKALDEIKNTSFDLALLDVVMPEVDGFKFAESFREFQPNTPVVFVSAHNANENKIKSYGLGSYAYIEKPFDVNIIRAQIQNVLNLKTMQDKLLKEKEKLDKIYQFSTNEIILTDLNFNIISQNYKILDKEMCEDKNFVEILKTDSKTENISLLSDFVKSNKNTISFRFISEDNKYTKTNISKVHEGGITTGYLIIINDLTEELEIQRQRDRFIETLTHDLKTPVRAEKRALELLLEGSYGMLNQEQKEMVTEILNSTRYMIHMTDNILTHYKIDNGQCQINKQMGYLKQTVQSCVDSLKYLLETENQILKVYSNMEDDYFAYDEVEIKRVLSNLVSNASEYSPKGTEISISLSRFENDVIICVEDEGPGISKEKLDIIFDEYITGAKRFKKVGSGLGLFITKKIIEAHEGRIIVKAKAGGGSKFTFSLPYEKTCVKETIEF